MPILNSNYHDKQPSELDLAEKQPFLQWLEEEAQPERVPWVTRTELNRPLLPAAESIVQLEIT